MSAPSTATAPLLQAIGQISVRASDLPRAVRFYRDQLGLTYLFEAPGMAFFECGGVWLYLAAGETAEFDHASSVLYFDVADIHAAHRTLKERGVHFRDEPHLIHRAGEKELWMTFFDDSEGNVFALRQWRSAQ
jgi:methylmalonyl-CoA/ethylmalonyl-CoA epimerase